MMQKIILFTNMNSIQKHWQNALSETYRPIVIDDFDSLLSYLEKDDTPITILLDELSVLDIVDAIHKLKPFHFINLLIFNAVPEVYHASNLLKEGINGYENSFIAKKNLHKMIACTNSGEKWLFTDLIYFIINQYTRSITKGEPEFMSELTEKEREVSLMIADGLSNKDIAQKMKIALSTVKGHVHHIFEKAGVNDRVSLALKFK